MIRNKQIKKPTPKKKQSQNTLYANQLLAELDDLEESGCGEMAAWEIIAGKHDFEDGSDLMSFIGANADDDIDFEE